MRTTVDASPQIDTPNILDIRPEIPVSATRRHSFKNRLGRAMVSTSIVIAGTGVGIIGGGTAGEAIVRSVIPKPWQTDLWSGRIIGATLLGIPAARISAEYALYRRDDERQ